ncbi:MAG: hypothetical protein ACRD22_15130 [Terriglobia bacterium]
MPIHLSSSPHREIDGDDARRQVERIVRSAAFRGSPVLQRFLEHVVNKTVQGLSHEIKEYEIAIEVLGKSSDYDPRLDTTVRTQAHRLREKLEEYYSNEGASDGMRIELPKGHYVPQFTRRKEAGEVTNGSRDVSQFAARMTPAPPLKLPRNPSSHSHSTVAGSVAVCSSGWDWLR